MSCELLTKSFAERIALKYFLGVDVGGTTSTLAVGDENRRVVQVSEQFPTTPDLGPESSIAAIEAAAVATLARLNTTLASVQMVGLATPGPATMDGVLLATPNLKRELWNNCPIRAVLEAALRRHQLRLSRKVHRRWPSGGARRVRCPQRRR